MKARIWVTGAVAVGLALVGTASQATPIPVITTVTEGTPQPLRSVQYYNFRDPYDDDYGYAPSPADRPAYRVYRPPPAYDYYGRPAYGRHGYRDYLQEQKQIIKSQRRHQKEMYKERLRYENRKNGYR